MPDDRTVRGYCPLGCGATLFLAAGGCVTCSSLNCPRPDAGLAADVVGFTVPVC